MKLKGIAVTFPVCDLRPFFDSASRVPFLSTPLIERGQTHIRGFGVADERKRLRIPWRSTDTVFFHCSGAISLPDRLPDGTPVTHVVRRVYLDGRALVRFEFAIYTYPERRYPKSNGRLDEFARVFWEHGAEIIEKGKKNPESFATALPKLVTKFTEMTSQTKSPHLEMCKGLEPQLQIMAEASEEELGSGAKPIESEGKIFLNFQSLRLPGKAASVDTVYLTHLPGYFAHPPGIEFQRWRMIRAHISWLHADLEILTHMLRSCVDGVVDPIAVAPYLIELTNGLWTVPKINEVDRKLIFELMTILEEVHDNRVSRLLDSLRRSKMPKKIKDNLSTLLERHISPEVSKVEVERKPASDALFNEPLGSGFLEDVFKHAPLLYYYSNDKTLKTEQPLANKRVVLVLHFLRDLLPFMEGLKRLGLKPQNTTLFYKDYPYPQKESIKSWLTSQGFGVFPHSNIRPFLKWLTEDGKDQLPLLIIEDGGFFVPAIHREYPQLIEKTIGAVEQTTRGIMNAEDWLKESESNKIKFPVLSIATSRLKGKFEPPYIARAVVNNIGRMLPDIALSGKKIGVFGCGTIGKEIALWLRVHGANVMVYDSNEENKLLVGQTGFPVAGSAQEAGGGKTFVIGCTGRKSIDSTVIAALDHDTFLVSASSEQYEIDVDELRQQAKETKDYKDDSGKLLGATLLLPRNRHVHLLANGYPINFWGMNSMPDEASDLIMTLIFLAAVSLAREPNRTPGIDAEGVNQLADEKHFNLARKFTEFHEKA